MVFAILATLGLRVGERSVMVRERCSPTSLTGEMEKKDNGWDMTCNRIFLEWMGFVKGRDITSSDGDGMKLV